MCIVCKNEGGGGREVSDRPSVLEGNKESQKERIKLMFLRNTHLSHIFAVTCRWRVEAALRSAQQLSLRRLSLSTALSCPRPPESPGSRQEQHKPQTQNHTHPLVNNSEISSGNGLSQTRKTHCSDKPRTWSIQRCPLSSSHPSRPPAAIHQKKTVFRGSGKRHPMFLDPQKQRTSFSRI